MELGELVGLRPLPGAGLLLALTQRCPLRCAHCSTASTAAGAQPPAARLRRFVASFGDQDRPAVLLMTGGEPLLRPELVAELAYAARRRGTRSAVLTGAFFARTSTPAAIRAAIEAVDHFSVSVDAFHERQIPRRDVFRLLAAVLDSGVPVSIHAVGAGADDPYLDGLVADVRRRFGDRVPMLVNTIRPVGRAAAWAAARPLPARPGEISPCAMAAWPVVAADGLVLACCNQDVVDRRPAPGHLRLGHIDDDDWPAIRRRLLTAPVLRMIRSTGPAHLISRYGAPPIGAPGYCAGCRQLADRPEVLAAAGRAAAGAVGELVDRQVAAVQLRAGPVDFVRRYGSARHAHLVDARGAARS
ncbi:radical SAM protein [Actinoplanes sp. KI2]|uniref:radical SAM protein n=1 Tax=Actinoplanes sp. KI2 TaxID=2983315 RepID=UPI0021D58636|nr:radical SAM protein [Actinoplanes sp. KI2]MCU7730688.1 radical SAM protein [Actinoplanes sp. KI2]